jgi:hypothetical protein
VLAAASATPYVPILFATSPFAAMRSAPTNTSRSPATHDEPQPPSAIRTVLDPVLHQLPCVRRAPEKAVVVARRAPSSPTPPLRARRRRGPVSAVREPARVAMVRTVARSGTRAPPYRPNRAARRQILVVDRARLPLERIPRRPGPRGRARRAANAHPFDRPCGGSPRSAGTREPGQSPLIPTSTPRQEARPGAPPRPRPPYARCSRSRGAPRTTIARIASAVSSASRRRRTPRRAGRSSVDERTHPGRAPVLNIRALYFTA